MFRRQGRTRRGHERVGLGCKLPPDTALRAQGQAGATCTSNLVGAGRPGRQRCRQAVRVLWGHVDVLGGVPRRSCGVSLRPRGWSSRIDVIGVAEHDEVE